MAKRHVPAERYVVCDRCNAEWPDDLRPDTGKRKGGRIALYDPIIHDQYGWDRNSDLCSECYAAASMMIDEWMQVGDQK